MSRIPRDLFEVHAPDETLAWVASHGWISDLIDLEHAYQRRNDLVIEVGADRWMRELTGTAPLAAVVRVDRDLQELIDRLERFFAKLSDLAEETGSR
jgi:hypothetical protein